MALKDILKKYLPKAGEVAGNSGLALLDILSNTVGIDAINEDQYKGTGADAFATASTIGGEITKTAAPIVAGALAGPAGGMIAQGVQGIGSSVNQFVDTPGSESEERTREITRSFAQPLAQLGSMALSGGGGGLPAGGDWQSATNLMQTTGALTAKNGGYLSNRIKGPSHEDGGVSVSPTMEVEGGEFIKDNMVYSDNLTRQDLEGLGFPLKVLDTLEMRKGGTLADAFDKLQKRYPRDPELDYITRTSKERDGKDSLIKKVQEVAGYMTNPDLNPRAARMKNGGELSEDTYEQMRIQHEAEMEKNFRDLEHQEFMNYLQDLPSIEVGDQEFIDGLIENRTRTMSIDSPLQNLRFVEPKDQLNIPQTQAAGYKCGGIKKYPNGGNTTTPDYLTEAMQYYYAPEDTLSTTERYLNDLRYSGQRNLVPERLSVPMNPVSGGIPEPTLEQMQELEMINPVEAEKSATVEYDQPSLFRTGGLSRSKDYGSKSKPYPKVQPSDFAGGKRSYPIPTKADAVDALRLAGLHNKPDVRAKVFKKYPSLKKLNGGKMEYGNGGPKSFREAQERGTPYTSGLDVSGYQKLSFPEGVVWYNPATKQSYTASNSETRKAFEKAFGAARSRGEEEFAFRGDRFTTELASSSPETIYYNQTPDTITPKATPRVAPELKVPSSLPLTQPLGTPNTGATEGISGQGRFMPELLTPTIGAIGTGLAGFGAAAAGFKAAKEVDPFLMGRPTLDYARLDYNRLATETAKGGVRRGLSQAGLTPGAYAANLIGGLGDISAQQAQKDYQVDLANVQALNRNRETQFGADLTISRFNALQQQKAQDKKIALKQQASEDLFGTMGDIVGGFGSDIAGQYKFANLINAKSALTPGVDVNLDREGLFNPNLDITSQYTNLPI